MEGKCYDPCRGCKVTGRCCHFAIKESNQKLIHPNLKCRYLGNDGKSMEYMLKYDCLPSGCLFITSKGAKTVSENEGRRILKKMIKIWKENGYVPHSVPDFVKDKVKL